MTAAMTSSHDSKRASWIPGLFAAAFAVVAAANGAMIYFATTSATPLVADRPYERGLAYNEVLARGAVEDALGWSGAVRFSPLGANRGEIVATIAGRDGAPVPKLVVTAHVFRPIEAAPGVDAVLAPRADGSYGTDLELAKPGQWQVDVTARRGDDVYAFGRRIVVR